MLWVRIGASGGVWKASWSHLGTSWESLGGLVGSLGGFLGAFWQFFKRIFCHLEQCVKTMKNLGKPTVFHGFLRFWEGPEAQKIAEKLINELSKVK